MKNYLFILFLLPFTLLSAETTILDENHTIRADLKMLYFKDYQGLSILDIQKKEKAGKMPWKKVPYHGYSFGHVTHPVWVKISLKNPSENEKYYFSFLYTVVDSLELFIPETGFYKKGGMKFPESRELPGARHHFSFKIKKGQLLDLYIKVDTKYNFFSTSWISPEKDIFYSLWSANLPNFVFSIICLMVIFLNLLYFSMNKKTIHMYFSGYVFFLLLYQVEMLGYSWITGVNNYYINEFILHFSMELSVFFNIYFVIKLFQLETEMPRLAEFYKNISWLAFAGIVFYLTGQDGYTRIINSLYMVLLFFSYYYVAIIYIKRNGSVIFIISWSLAMLGYSIYAMNNLGILPLKLEYIHTTIILGTLEIIGITYLIPSFGALTAIKKTTDRLILNSSILPQKYKKSIITEKLNEVMEKEKLYLDWNANLNTFAEKTGLPAHIISRYLNIEEQLGFRDILNKYRVDHAKELLSKEPDATILNVLYQSGFNSKATFNRIFKEITGITPLEYKKEIQTVKKAAVNN